MEVAFVPLYFICCGWDFVSDILGIIYIYILSGAPSLERTLKWIIDNC